MSDTFWSEAQARLDNALSTFDWSTATRITNELEFHLRKTGKLPTAGEAKRVLEALRRKRRFGDMEGLAEVLANLGGEVLHLRSLYAQSLVDQGKLAPAKSLLREVLADASSPAGELAEAAGILGRAQKQSFVTLAESPRAAELHLRNAVSTYGAGYAKNKAANYWHGINLVALVARARREKIQIDETLDPLELARTLIETTRLLDGTEAPWTIGTRVEANLALGRWEEADGELDVYLAHRYCDAFEIGSTLRQLKEIWGLSAESDPGGRLVAKLESALLRQAGGEVSLTKIGLHRLSAATQRNFDNEAQLPLAWLKKGLERCATVARIENRTGRKFGTGFVVDPGPFFGTGAGAPKHVLLTNWHVLNPEGAGGAVRPDAAGARFQHSGKTYDVEKIVGAIPHLDACFFTLKTTDEFPDRCDLEPRPDAFDETRKPAQRVYVIGHPNGGDLVVSLHDSHWLDFDGTVLHYRTPTDPGSSGSPIFDQENWTLIGLHRAGCSEMPRLNGKPGTYEANEGVSIEKIRVGIRGG